VGKLREGMGRESNAVERILSHGCGRERMPIPGGPHALHSAVAETRPQGDWCRTLLVATRLSSRIHKGRGQMAGARHGRYSRAARHQTSRYGGTQRAYYLKKM
jgi:hypothetical protein